LLLLRRLGTQLGCNNHLPAVPFSTCLVFFSLEGSKLYPLRKNLMVL
jgi:hypothetical protein